MLKTSSNTSRGPRDRATAGDSKRVEPLALVLRDVSGRPGTLRWDVLK
jgi:hypothetical protein